MSNNVNETVRGIVVAGNSRQEAEEAYRAVATGVSVQALQDSDNSFTILSNAGSDITLMNPLTGELDLVEASSDLVGRMEFVASDSEEQLNTFYTLCSTGCNSHIIADDPELMVHCPVCASSLEDLDQNSINEIVASSSEDEIDAEYAEDSVIAVASSKKEALKAFALLSSGVGSRHGLACESAVVISNASSDEFSYSPFSGESVSSVDLDGVNIELIASLSSSDDTVEAHYYICANTEDCGSHVVASCDTPVFCPSCSSGLIEPDEEEEKLETSLSSADEDYSDEDEELDDSDEDYSEEDEDSDDSDDSDEDYSEEDEDSDDSDEDEELDEDDESLSSNDDSEEDDSEEEDDSDEDSSDEEEDDSDEEDESTLSVSNVTFKDDEEAVASTKKIKKAKKAKIVAKAKPVDMVSVSSSLLYIAAAGESLDPSNLEVAYAGNIQDTGTWLAFYKGMPVAKATAASAAAHSEIFNTPTFGKAVIANARESGNVMEAISSMGFEVITPTFSVESHVEREIAEQVEARVADVTAEYEANSSDYNERFLAALATAAQGINRNFFRGLSNPIKVALAGTMTAAGMRNPEEVIARAFADHSDGYHKTLINKASEIVAKTIDVQNELAEAVAGTNALMSAEASTAPLSVGKPVYIDNNTNNKDQESVSSGDLSFEANMASILGSLGQRKR